MESFRWGEQFVTRIAIVDQQHHGLVDLINRFGDLLTRGAGVSYADMAVILDELAAYAHYHFQDEEVMMQKVGLRSEHFEQHKMLHDDFLQEVIRMQQDLSQHRTDAQRLLKFLTHWLALHILGVDQSMARQVAAIEAGQTAEQAFQAEKLIKEHATEPLLEALNGLFREVSARNKQLEELNRTLEAKVEERTRALSEANRQLEQLAMIDVLTGLSNRRYAMTRLAQAWSEATRNALPLACMMLDADGFKQVNDQYGHEAGDSVLRQLAKQFLRSVRSHDLVCRMGGDEFLIICPGTALEGALHVARTMCQNVAKLKLTFKDDQHWSGSISVGVAVRNATMQSCEDLIKAADDALYQAKRNGRNRVEHA